MLKFFFLCTFMLFASSIVRAKTNGQLADSLLEANVTIQNELAKAKSIIEQSNLTMKILDQRLLQASDTINNQSTIVSSFEIIYSILTIVFTIIGLLTPLVTYFFGIKPSRDQIKQLEANFDNKLAEYLQFSRISRIDNALKNLEGGNIQEKQNAITFLSLTQHEGFSDMQLFKLLKAINSKNTDEIQKITLASLLTTTENEYATQYCQKLLKDGNTNDGNINIEFIPARYFGLIGVTNHLADFKEYLLSVSDKKISLAAIVSHMRTISIEAVVEMFNSDEIADLFEDADLLPLGNQLKWIFKGKEADSIKITKLGLRIPIN